MCTAIGIRMGDFYFGRSMDVERGFGESVTLIQRSFPLKLRYLDTVHSHHAILGTAVCVDGYPLYADAFNEKGLCMAGLLFPDNAYYPSTSPENKTALCPFELIPYILGKCSDINEARSELESISLVNTPFNEDIPLSPLHWIICDRHGSLTVEPTKEGLLVYENVYSVLANNPPFPFHTENVKRYINLSPSYSGTGVLKELSPFGGGLCATGLDGDYSSPSRFVKAAFLTRTAIPPKSDTQEAQAAHVFALLGAVSPPHGAVLDKNGQPHFTHYTCCINADKGVYYLRRYTELDAHVFKMTDSDLSDCLMITHT